MAEKLAYSISEVVDLTGISRSKIYEEIRDGQLRAVKSGHRTLILCRDLEDWLTSLPETRGTLHALQHGGVTK
jgi:excisionase family DNA binding protein